MLDRSFKETLFLSLFVLLPTVWCSDNRVIQSFCKNLPHPGTCEFFLSRSPPNITGSLRGNSLGVLLKLSQDQASHGLTYTHALGPRCKDLKEKEAWDACLELYQDTVEQLTNANSLPCTGDDKQTWMSAALTNLETCKAGFEELGVTANIYPLISNNASYLISNCLALNKGSKPSTTYVDGFPDWVKPGDRKLLQSSSANAVVAQDGSGNYKTVSQAVAAASGGRFVIHVKAGVYNENVQIRKANVMLVGDGIGKTIITSGRSVGSGSTTFRSATVGIYGQGFIAQGITFRNDAGPGASQAVAVRSGSDRSVFYQCGFEGYQDTLYAYTQRQFYKSCDIYGTVDFIFGNAAVVIQSSNIYVRNANKPFYTITAQGRSDPNQNTGISIHGCNIGGAVNGKAYLGRPWHQYSRTVVMKSNLGSVINSAGWHPWNGGFALNTLYYGEYANSGPGSSTSGRVSWNGYHVITSPAVASQFTVGSFIAGSSWLPSTGVPFTAGL